MQTFEEFCKVAVGAIKKPFETMGEIPPTWFLQKPDGEVGMFVTPWNGNNEKEFINQKMKVLMEEHRVIRYVLVTEAWSVKVKKPEGIKSVKDWDWKGLPPSQHPDRQEMMMIVGGDLEGDCLEGMADIIRDKEGNPTLGEFKLDFNKYTMEGRFVNLLRRIH